MLGKKNELKYQFISLKIPIYLSVQGEDNLNSNNLQWKHRWINKAYQNHKFQPQLLTYSLPKCVKIA